MPVLALARTTIVAASLLLLAAAPARAVMDINDRGPVLQAGNFAMRITNIGVIGNAFFNQGLSFDPSFEYPRGSGHECLNHAELWVGARLPNGHLRVSGGPMLEWRPTLDPHDVVRTAWAGTPGTRRGVDDDGDGKIDEEILNGKDDDGDGEIDEDIGVIGQEMMGADFTDDQPAAINYGYPNGEQHEPLHLAVHQDAFCWSVPGYDAIAGIQFTVTNIGTTQLRDLYMGVLADLDSRTRNGQGGHLDDEVVRRTYARAIAEGTSTVNAAGINYIVTCVTNLTREVPIVTDSHAGSGLPASAILPLDHTTDPLAYITNTAFQGVADVERYVRAPAQDTSFHYLVWANDLPPGFGGPPVLDGDRYLALQGRYPEAPDGHVGDPTVMLHCGPFQYLNPGQSLTFAVALCAAPSVDSLVTTLANTATLYHGQRVNLIADESQTIGYKHGRSGLNGHEVCLEPPEGLSFEYDPHCPETFLIGPVAMDDCEQKVLFHAPQCPPNIAISESDSIYTHGHCIWTNADCDLCTGFDGAETRLHWPDPGTTPPAPALHTVRGDHASSILWDNEPEILLRAGLAGAPGFTFAGYRVYRLSDWSRQTILPPPSRWQLIGAFGPDSSEGDVPLAAALDTTVDWDLLQYGQRHYPPGRYRMRDRDVLNGFDYLYVVTAVIEQRVTLGTDTRLLRLESPLIASIDSVVVPHTDARPAAGQTWVVPNPYRGASPWDRPPVPGDPFGRHVDFMGLPKALATVRIYTVAGDLVQSLVHDGRGGDGEAPWNLISRNGQDIESGIYLFTVDSSLGHQIGRFVVIR